MASAAASTPAPYPGQRLGLPAEGRGSLASWGSRIGALLIDWAACMAVAVGFFSSAVLTGQDWRRFMILAVFFLEASVLTWFAGGSFGQLLCRLAVARTDREPVDAPRALLRTALLCLGLPALIIGPDRRGLHDLAAGTVVVNRR